jgi:hypothetical protein
MADLASIVSNAVAIANTQTASLQEDVIHHTWTSQSSMSGPAYTSVTRKALVEQRVTQHRMTDGRMVPVRAKLTFLTVIPPNGASKRVEPIDPKDKFTLADGTIGSIIDVQGLRDPGRGRPYLLEVWLG